MSRHVRVSHLLISSCLVFFKLFYLVSLYYHHHYHHISLIKVVRRNSVNTVNKITIKIHTMSMNVNASCVVIFIQQTYDKVSLVYYIKLL